MENFIPGDSDNLKVKKGVEAPSSINPLALKKNSNKAFRNTTSAEFAEGIRNGNMTILSRAITMIESSKAEHREKAAEILEKCLPLSGKSVRIGITGVPGVGKSTFIEAFGTMLIRKFDKKVAVLAVDPSSSITHGSILGDKTRMLELSSEKNAFIRPSPSAGSLGGVAQKTRETLILCEAAGFDVIIIETVGVGQSETTVHSMVDFFLLLMLAGAGDELQGIKRGIMELADLLVINKSDDLPVEKVNLAKRTYENALHLFPPTGSGWIPLVKHCSSVNKTGVEDVWQTMEEYLFLTRSNGYFDNNRQQQSRFWFYETLNAGLLNRFYENKVVQHKLKMLEKDVISEKVSPFEAAEILLKEKWL